MSKKEAIKVFEDRKIRSLWDDETEDWYFSIVDVVAALSDSVNPTAYWCKLKERLKKEGNQSVTDCHGFKRQAADSKMRTTDCGDTKQLFRLIQSIPSPKAEPLKLWMAQVASERIDQIQDPELSIEQGLKDYKRLGYSDNWINQRLKSIEIRKELTDDVNVRTINQHLKKIFSDSELQEDSVIRNFRITATDGKNYTLFPMLQRGNPMRLCGADMHSHAGAWERAKVAEIEGDEA